MSKKTKDIIIANALSLFNRYGFVSVRLQHVADECNISVGNLAYHFKTKDEIVENIYKKLEAEQKELLAEMHIVPLFVNIDIHLNNVFELQQKYSFFYSDTFEIMRAFPKIKKKYRDYSGWFIMQIANMLQFNIARGAISEADYDKSFAQLANNYFTLLELWHYQNRIRGIALKSVDDFKSAIWALLIPHFTQLGHKEYQQINTQLNYNWL